MTDIEKKKFNSASELLQFRSNAIKQRDLIARTIVKHKLFDNKNFPYYILAYNLWYIARNYYYMYRALPKKISKEDIDLLNKTNKYFDFSFSRISNKELIERHKVFSDLIKNSNEKMKKYKINGIESYCNSILFLIQSCSSSILILNS